MANKAKQPGKINPNDTIRTPAAPVDAWVSVVPGENDAPAVPDISGGGGGSDSGSDNEDDSNNGNGNGNGHLGQDEARRVALDLLHNAGKTGHTSQVRAPLPEGVWTMEMMEEGEPVQGDLFGDGRFTFMFKPILNDVAIQRRFRFSKHVNPETGENYYELVKGYAEVLRMVLVSWPLQEEVTDENEDPVYEQVPDPDGEPDPETGLVPTISQVMLRPLPLKLKNIERLPTDKAVLFFLAMQRALSGEASAKP